MAIYGNQSYHLEIYHLKKVFFQKRSQGTMTTDRVEIFCGSSHRSRFVIITRMGKSYEY